MTVHVTDDNDNVPRFQFLSPYKMTVMEDAPLGTRVGRVQAFDSDAGQNAVFEYAITHANIGRSYDKAKYTKQMSHAGS